MATTTSLKNINFMSKSKYDSITPSDDELYAVDTPAIVETYIGDSDWYFVYSNGWCVQGGNTQTSATTTVSQIVLKKEYRDTKYTILALPNASSSTGYAFNDMDEKTAAGFTLRSSAACYGFNWEAKGYIK